MSNSGFKKGLDVGLKGNTRVSETDRWFKSKEFNKSQEEGIRAGLTARANKK